jgi:hypothetical protein
MIRINLLKGRAGSADRLPPALTTDGISSKFLPQRELVLAVALAAIGGGIIAAQVFGVFEEPADDTYVAVYERPGGPPPAARPAPEPEPTIEPLPDPELVDASAEPAAPAPNPARAVAAAVAPVPPIESSADSSIGDSPSYTVAGLRLVEWGEAIEVFVDVEGAPEYRSFWVNNPDRLVLDLEDAELSRSDVHPLISQLRVAQNSFDLPIVRIVVETVRNEGPIEITAAFGGIPVKLAPAP